MVAVTAPLAVQGKSKPWLTTNTVPVSDLAHAGTVRRALDIIALTQTGTAAAATTVARKRAVSGCLRYAVELGLLESHPFSRVQWSTPKSVDTVDRRVVVNPDQARALLAAVDDIDAPLTAFFGCMYYAALRPAEALYLRHTDCTLPENGWASYSWSARPNRAAERGVTPAAPRRIEG